MSKVTADISMSLDGFVTEPNPGGENPLGDDPCRLHDWIFSEKTATHAEVVDEIYTYPLFSAKVTDQTRPTARDVADRIRQRYGVELSEQEILESPHVFIGSIASLMEMFRMLRDRLGINHIFVGEDYRDFAPIVQALSGT